MSKGKLAKFAEYDSFSNTFDFNDDTAGGWSEYFGNNNPIVLELACGRGEYTVGLAQQFPEKNFIGIDIKGARLWKGAKFAMDHNLKNAAFLRIQIDNLASYFAQGEVSEIWITFADPQPSKKRKRLTHPKFLKIYNEILSSSGNQLIHLKTDSDLLFDFTLETLEELQIKPAIHYSNIYELSIIPAELQIQTYYEKMWLGEGRTIKYLNFHLTQF